MPKSRPIIFNSESVRAILDGRKTQTRRVIKRQPKWKYPGNNERDGVISIIHGDYMVTAGFGLACEGHNFGKCPYGVPGDKLWVKETWATLSHFDDILPRNLPDYTEIIFKVADEDNMLRGKWRSSIYLPKKFSRIAPEIKDVRVERVQDITARDIWSEGMKPNPIWDVKNDFVRLWNSINAKKGFGWDTNPWVWVLEFERSDNG